MRSIAFCGSTGAGPSRENGGDVHLAARAWVVWRAGLVLRPTGRGWHKVVEAVHAKGGRMFSQLWHTGRSSRVELAGGAAPVSASVNPAYWQDASHLVSAPGGWPQPSPHRALDVAEIPGIVGDHRKAAERAKAAGFDGVELRAANGYLPDQFLQDGTWSAR